MFIHDPLYKWMLSPLQAIKRQRNADKVQNPDNGDATNGTGVDGADGTTKHTKGQHDGGGGDAVALLEAADGNNNNNEASGMREAAERTLTRIRQKLQGCV